MTGRITYQPGMDPHPRSTDCDLRCNGRARDKAGRRIACAHNGFIGIPLTQLATESTGRQRYTPADLKPSYDGRRGPRMWKAPRLSDVADPFVPDLGEVGSFVSWTESVERRSMSGIPEGRYELVERRGQVWSAAYPEQRRRRVCVVDEHGAHYFVAIEDLRPIAAI